MQLLNSRKLMCALALKLALSGFGCSVEGPMPQPKQACSSNTILISRPGEKVNELNLKAGQKVALDEKTFMLPDKIDAGKVSFSIIDSATGAELAKFAKSEGESAELAIGSKIFSFTVCNLTKESVRLNFEQPVSLVADPDPFVPACEPSQIKESITTTLREKESVALDGCTSITLYTIAKKWNNAIYLQFVDPDKKPVSGLVPLSNNLEVEVLFGDKPLYLHALLKGPAEILITFGSRSITPLPTLNCTKAAAYDFSAGGGGVALEGGFTLFLEAFSTEGPFTYGYFQEKDQIGNLLGQFKARRRYGPEPSAFDFGKTTYGQDTYYLEIPGVESCFNCTRVIVHSLCTQ